jgi:hypothetical protein
LYRLRDMPITSSKLLRLSNNVSSRIAIPVREDRCYCRYSLHFTSTVKCNSILRMFLFQNYRTLHETAGPIRVAARSKAWTAFGRSNTENVGSNQEIVPSLSGSRAALRPTQTPFQRVQGVLSPEVKLLRREVHYSPPYSAEVKNGGAITPLPYTSSWRDAYYSTSRHIIIY